MRILFLSGDLCDGGAQRVTATISSRLAENGHNVSLLVFSRSERDYPISQKVQLIYMCGSANEYNKTTHIQRLAYIRKRIHAIKPDVAIGFLQAGYALYFASLGMKFPRIASARVSPERIMTSKGVIASINRFWFRHADAVILQNKEQLELSKDYGWHNMVVISNPLSDSVMSIEKRKYSEVCRRFVMAGRITVQKNYMLAIDAMKVIHSIYPDVILDIFGEGSLKKELQAIVCKAGLEDVIHFKGWSEAITNEFLKYDAYILTSNFEGQPNSLMEAMATGLPCISTSCKTGPKELINGNNGILINPNDLKQLISAMESLITMDKESRQRMGNEAKRHMIDSYSVSVIAQKWEMMLESICR